MFTVLILQYDMDWNYTWTHWKAFLLMSSTSYPYSPALFSADFSMFLVETTVWKNFATFVLSYLFCGVTSLQFSLVTNPSQTSSYIQSHSHQANSLYDSRWSNCPMFSVGVHGVFFSRPPSLLPPSASEPPLFPLPQYCPIHSTHDYSRATFSVSIYAQPDAVDITDQDCLTTLFDTRIVENLAC